MPARAGDADIELRLLVDAIYLKYHYDFREYATASLKRRLKSAMLKFDCATLSELQGRVLHESFLEGQRPPLEQALPVALARPPCA